MRFLGVFNGILKCQLLSHSDIVFVHCAVLFVSKKLQSSELPSKTTVGCDRVSVKASGISLI